MKTTSVRNVMSQVTLLAIAAMCVITTTQVQSQQVQRNGVPASQGSRFYGAGCPSAYKPGNYAFIGFGQELATNPFGEPAGPIASLLIVNSAGDGTLTVQRTDFADGVLVTTPTLPGTYTVGADCTVNDTIPVPGTNLNLTGYGVVVQGGAEVDYMATTTGVVIQNYVGRQMPKGCSNATLKGAYGLNGTGTALGNPMGNLTSIATLYFDGAGNFSKQDEEDFINGALYPQSSLSGTYSVTPDCLFTLTATGADNFTANGAIVDRGATLDLIPVAGVFVEAVVGKKL